MCVCHLESRWANMVWCRLCVYGVYSWVCLGGFCCLLVGWRFHCILWWCIVILCVDHVIWLTMATMSSLSRWLCWDDGCFTSITYKSCAWIANKICNLIYTRPTSHACLVVGWGRELSHLVSNYNSQKCTSLMCQNHSLDAKVIQCQSDNYSFSWRDQVGPPNFVT